MKYKIIILLLSLLMITSCNINPQIQQAKECYLQLGDTATPEKDFCECMGGEYLIEQEIIKFLIPFLSFATVYITPVAHSPFASLPHSTLIFRAGRSKQSLLLKKLQLPSLHLK